MSTLSAIREASSVEESSAPARSPTSGNSPGSANRNSAQIFDFPNFPTFSYSKDAEDAASRFANRVVAAVISEPEHQRLLDERQKLLDKELAGNISAEEKNRLAYVRWSLDRIDDAKYGAEIERLQDLALQYERFHADIEKFQAELERLSKSRRSYPRS